MHWIDTIGGYNRYGWDSLRTAVIPPQDASNVGYPVVINSIVPAPTPRRGYPISGILAPVGLSNTNVG